jgi:hypothetical protein
MYGTQEDTTTPNGSQLPKHTCYSMNTGYGALTWTGHFRINNRSTGNVESLASQPTLILFINNQGLQTAAVDGITGRYSYAYAIVTLDAIPVYWITYRQSTKYQLWLR